MGKRKNQENVIEVPENRPPSLLSEDSPTPATTPTPSEESPPNTGNKTETPSAPETEAESATVATSEPSPKQTESAAPVAPESDAARAAAPQPMLVEASKLAAAPDLLAKHRALAERQRAKQASYEEAKEEASRRKKDWEVACEETQNCILEVEGQPELPFGGSAAPATETPKSDNASDPTKMPPDDFDAAFCAALASASLLDIGIDAKIALVLEADGIKTGEQVQKWISTHPEPRKIAGLGAKKAEQVKLALEEWSLSQRTAWDAAHPATPAARTEYTAHHTDPESDARNAFVTAVKDRVGMVYPGERTAEFLGEAAKKLAQAVTNAGDPTAAVNIANANEIEAWSGILKNMNDDEVNAVIGASEEPAEKAVQS